MPLPFEPLIHFNPNVFRQKRERKLYLYQCATVLRLVQLHFVFVWLLFNSMSLPLLCIFSSCLLILPQPLFTIYSFLSNKRSFIIAVCSVAVCLFFHVPYIFEERTEKNKKMYGGVQFLAIDATKTCLNSTEIIPNGIEYMTHSCSFRLSHEIQ